jgi:hypothetical protein
VKNRKLAKKYREWLEETAFPSLYPPFKEEYYVLQQIDDAAATRKFNLIIPLSLKADILDTLRFSKSFTAVPEIQQEDLVKINEALSRVNIPPDQDADYDMFETKKWTAQALGLEYNPRMPIEEYLDIIIPRKKKINAMIDGFIARNDKNLQQSINDEIWEINKEIATSKTIESYSWFAKFVSSKAVISGVLAAITLGVSTSLLGCGLESIVGSGSVGSVGASVTAKVIENYGLKKGLKLPKPPKKTVEWLKEKLENPQEKLLAKMLSKDVPVIQVWSLRSWKDPNKVVFFVSRKIETICSSILPLFCRG